MMNEEELREIKDRLKGDITQLGEIFGEQMAMIASFFYDKIVKKAKEYEGLLEKEDIESIIQELTYKTINNQRTSDEESNFYEMLGELHEN